MDVDYIHYGNNMATRETEDSENVKLLKICKDLRTISRGCVCTVILPVTQNFVTTVFYDSRGAVSYPAGNELKVRLYLSHVVTAILVVGFLSPFGDFYVKFILFCLTLIFIVHFSLQDWYSHHWRCNPLLLLVHNGVEFLKPVLVFHSYRILFGIFCNHWHKQRDH